MTIRFFINAEDHQIGSDTAREAVKRLDSLRQQAKYGENGIKEVRSKLVQANNNKDENAWVIEVETDNPHLELPHIPGARRA